MGFEDEYNALALRIAKATALAAEAQELGECDLEQRAQSKIQQLLQSVDCLVEQRLGSGYQCPLCQPMLLQANLKPLYQLRLRNCAKHSRKLLQLYGRSLLLSSDMSEDGPFSNARKEPTSEIPLSTANSAPNSDSWSSQWPMWQRRQQGLDALIASNKRSRTGARIRVGHTRSLTSGAK